MNSKKTIEFGPQDLHEGKCNSCGEKGDVTEEGICPDCTFDRDFYEETMKPNRHFKSLYE